MKKKEIQEIGKVGIKTYIILTLFGIGMAILPVLLIILTYIYFVIKGI